MNLLHGLPTDQPCDVCGKVDECEADTWFNYVVCQKHGHWNPQRVAQAKYENERIL